MEESEKTSDSIEIPIDGVLDLHTFNPRDIKELVADYLALCLEKDIFQVRIIHGKGIGVLRQTVHKMLEKLPCVESFHLAGENGGGWGATVVVLKKGYKCKS